MGVPWHKAMNSGKERQQIRNENLGASGFLHYPNNSFSNSQLPKRRCYDVIVNGMHVQKKIVRLYDNSLSVRTCKRKFHDITSSWYASETEPFNVELTKICKRMGRPYEVAVYWYADAREKFWMQHQCIASMEKYRMT